MDVQQAWEAIWNFAKPVLELALVAFAGTQLYLDRSRRRERQRVAYTALYAEYWRILALQLEVNRQSLVEVAKSGMFDPSLLAPKDWGTIIQLLGEVGSTTAAFGGYAYARLNHSLASGTALVNVARDGHNVIARQLEQQCKQGLGEAIELLQDALKAAPSWLGQHEFTLADPTSPLGKRVEEMLQGEQRRLRGGRHEPRLGFVGKHAGNALARLARWLNPAT